MSEGLKNTGMTNKLLSFFLSLRTAIWLLAALLCLLFYGAVLMPAREEFQALHAVPLFQWMHESPPAVTWWLWAAVGVLSVLTANTVLCTIESLVRKKGARHLLLVTAPQVAHIGFLFILLAHLVSGYGSFRGTAAVSEDTAVRLPNGNDVLFRAINVDMNPSGYVLDWSADIEYFRHGRSLGGDRIRPNAPSFRDGLGIFIKNIGFQPYPVAVIEVSREPGAVWALIGGILFMAGMMTLLFFKIKKEEAKGVGEG